MQIQSLGQEDPPEEEMATHSSVLAWRIPRTEEAGWLQRLGLQRVGHNGSSWAAGARAQQFWLPGSRAQGQWLRRMGLVVPTHVGSSWTGDRTCVSCTGRWIKYHWDTKEALFWVCLCRSFFFHSSLVLSSCGSMTVGLLFFSLVYESVCEREYVCVCVCIYCSFRVCCSHEVLIQQSIYVKGCFKFLVSSLLREVPLAFVAGKTKCNLGPNVSFLLPRGKKEIGWHQAREEHRPVISFNPPSFLKVF